MEQSLPCADVRLDFILGVAEHLLPSRGVHDRACFQVPVPYPLLRAGKRQLESFFVLAERCLGAFLFGQIEMGADDAYDWPTGLAAHGKAARKDGHIVPILVAQAELGFVSGSFA